MDENRYRLVGRFENLDTSRSFEVYQVVGVISHNNDHDRRLFRIEEMGYDKPFYKGICISRSNLAVEENKGKKLEDIWEQWFEDAVSKPLLYEDDVDKRSREIEVADSIFWKALNQEDGSYLPEIITNIRVGNLANELSSIPGGKK